MWCRGVEVDVKRLPKRPAPPRFGRKLTEAQKARLTVQWCNFHLALFLCIICLKWDLCNVHANMNEVDQFFRPKQRTYALIVATYTPCRNLSRSRQVYLWTLVKPFDWYQGLGITLVLYSSVVFEPDSPFLTFKSVLALWTILLTSEETKHLLFPRKYLFWCLMFMFFWDVSLQPDEYACPQCRAPKKRFARYDVSTGKAIGGGLPPIGVIIGLVAGLGGVAALLVYGLQWETLQLWIQYFVPFVVSFYPEIRGGFFFTAVKWSVKIWTWERCIGIWKSLSEIYVTN